MPVPSKMADLQTLAASNSPAGSDAIGNSLDDYLRAVQAIIRSTNALSSASIAAASTTDLGTSDGEYVVVTGSATITSLGSTPAGIVREVLFSGACTLTNSSAIVMAGGLSYTTVAGDVIRFRSLGSGNWRHISGPGFAYTPVQQGGGVGQSNDKLNIGWSSGSKLKATVNSVDVGNIALESFVTGLLTQYLPLTGGTITGSVFQDTAVIVPLQVRSSSTDSTRIRLSNSTVFTDIDMTVSGSANGSGPASCLKFRNLLTSRDLVQIENNAVGTTFGVWSGPNFVATSDRRIKENIRAREPRQFIADNLSMHDWTLKTDGSFGLGPIAQDVLEVAPEHVHEAHDGTLGLDRAGLALEAVMGLAKRVAELEARLK